MFDFHSYQGKTIREIQHRQGGEQIIIYFTDESFLIITGEGQFSLEKARHHVELKCMGKAVDK